MPDIRLWPNAIRQAAKKLADTVMAEMALEDNRHNVKLSVINQIMAAGDNRYTGKPHSFSSAETLATTEPAYLDYLERLRQAAHDRIMARGEYDAVLAASRLAQENNVNG